MWGIVAKFIKAMAVKYLSAVVVEKIVIWV